jgi:hypothetical protein
MMRKRNREQALLDIARVGLALLVENGATDHNARGRRDQREYKLITMLRQFAEKKRMMI